LLLAAATLGNNQFTGYGINGLAGGNITYATTGNFYGGVRVWTSQVRSGDSRTGGSQSTQNECHSTR
jgi:hypothetical protein